MHGLDLLVWLMHGYNRVVSIISMDPIISVG